MRAGPGRRGGDGRWSPGWIDDTGPLANLLLGTLAQTRDIFTSYRRSDGAPAAGRLHADLLDQFGERRVFFDRQGIGPSARWLPTIEQAIVASRGGIVVIGPGFLETGEDGRPRLWQSNDVMRQEIVGLMTGDRTILPVRIEGALLPAPKDLPEELRPSLVNYQASSLDNTNWSTTVLKGRWAQPA